MKNKGFSLIEIVISLFFIGLLTTIFVPLLTISASNFSVVEDKNEMNYIGEMVLEKLKTPSEEIQRTIKELDSLGEVNYLDEDFDSNKYICIIKSTYSSNNLLEIVVRIEQKNQENSNYVEYKGSIPKK